MTKCKRPSCGARFPQPKGQDENSEMRLLFCPSCREEMLAREAQVDNEEALVVSAAYASNMTQRSVWDIRIIDENGVEVWALDLAKRYKKQTEPRGY